MAKDNTAEKVLEIARKHIGETDGSEFVAFYNDITGIGLPLNAFWCACFVTYCVRNAKVPEDSVLNFKGCATGADWFRKKKRWREKAETPKVGDIIFFEWNPENEGTRYDDGADHVGFVTAVKNGRVETIEGNSGGECCENVYPIGYEYIEGYGIPKYNIDSEPQKPEKKPEKFRSYKVMVIAKDGLNCRKEAGTEYKVVKAYPYGTVLSIKAEKDGWGKTEDGWISLEWTEKYKKPTRVRITPPVGLNIRSAPNINGQLLGAYEYNKNVEIYDRQNGWGRTNDGWICLKYTEEV